MKHLILALFIFMSVNVFAQSTPTNVNRSPNTITQVDPYLVALKRLGIPSSPFDSLEGQGSSQNSIKLIYNTTLKKLRVYDPITLTWSDAVPTGGSDSTIYKTDGSTPDNRTAEFKGGLNLKSDNVIKHNVGNYNFITNTKGFAFASNTDSILLLDSMFGAYYRHVIPMTLNTQLTHKHYVDSMVASGGCDSVTASNGNQIMSDGSVGLGGTLSKNTMINVSDTSYLRFNGDIYEANFAGSIVSIFNKGGTPSLVFNNDELRIDVKKGSFSSSDYVLMIDSVSNLPTQQRFVRLVPKSEFSGGGDFIPMHITEPTVVDFDTLTYLQFGADGNALNIFKPVPPEFGDIASHYLGFDYTNPTSKGIVGVLYGVNYPPLGLFDATLSGTFSFVGDKDSGDYTISMNISLPTGSGFENINALITFEDSDIVGMTNLSLGMGEIIFTTGERIRFNAGGDMDIRVEGDAFIIEDEDNSLVITPSSLLVPTPPISGNYVLKSIDGVVQWVVE